MVTYSGSTVTVHGPMNLPDKVRKASQASLNGKCQMIFIVDANSGDVLQNFQTC